MAEESVGLPEQLSVVELSARLQESRKELMDAIAGLDEEGFRARPQAGAWSVAEVLTHLLMDEERLSEYARAALDQRDVPIIPLPDEQRDEETRGAARRMAVPQIIHGLLAQRRATLTQLDGVSREELDRPVRHPAYGNTSAGPIFQHIADHETEHAAQARALRKAPA